VVYESDQLTYPGFLLKSSCLSACALGQSDRSTCRRPF
jgi:hypothetical protein